LFNFIVFLVVLHLFHENEVELLEHVVGLGQVAQLEDFDDFFACFELLLHLHLVHPSGSRDDAYFRLRLHPLEVGVG